MFKNKAAKFS